MLNYWLKCLIEELGATGILIIGLYLILAAPIREMAGSLHKINEEIGRIIILLEKVLWRK